MEEALNKSKKAPATYGGRKGIILGGGGWTFLYVLYPNNII